MFALNFNQEIILIRRLNQKMNRLTGMQKKNQRVLYNMFFVKIRQKTKTVKNTFIVLPNQGCFNRASGLKRADCFSLNDSG